METDLLVVCALLDGNVVSYGAGGLLIEVVQLLVISLLCCEPAFKSDSN